MIDAISIFRVLGLEVKYALGEFRLVLALVNGSLSKLKRRLLSQSWSKVSVSWLSGGYCLKNVKNWLLSSRSPLAFDYYRYWDKSDNRDLRDPDGLGYVPILTSFRVIWWGSLICPSRFIEVFRFSSSLFILTGTGVFAVYSITLASQHLYSLEGDRVEVFEVKIGRCVLYMAASSLWWF